jgi:hypothetical protein
MVVKQITTFEVRCLREGCSGRFLRRFDSKREANKASILHGVFHDAFQVGVRVSVPGRYMGLSREPGRISTLWYDMEEAVVTLEKLRRCVECVHPHDESQWWRGKMADLEVLADG